MLQQFPVFRGLQGIADSNGNCTVQSWPLLANESLEINHVELNNPGPRTPTVFTYRNVIANSGFIEGTKGGLFNASDTIIQLTSAEVLYWVWSLATVGTICSVTVRGVRTVAIQ